VIPQGGEWKAVEHGSSFPNHYLVSQEIQQQPYWLPPTTAPAVVLLIEEEESTASTAASTISFLRGKKNHELRPAFYFVRSAEPRRGEDEETTTIHYSQEERDNYIVEPIHVAHYVEQTYLVRVAANS
jgi:hypothetical protein